MADTAADVLIDTLHEWGVDVIFGLPGDGINGLMEALRTRQEQVRFIQVRHEEAAAFMACGYAKLPASSASASRHQAPAVFTCSRCGRARKRSPSTSEPSPPRRRPAADRLWL